jgi:sulfur carrier protein ThiS
MFVMISHKHPSLRKFMRSDKNKNDSELAHLVLDKPLVDKKIDIFITAGQKYCEVLPQFITKPGVAYVVLVNGVVVDMDQEVQPGDEIRCVPQIIGG